jgi:glycosyltransferase involved in cell wall biosynthesis
LILDRLKELQVHALVNSSRYEGVPVSLMEGLSLGLPCIAPKIFGIPDVVENTYSGYLIQPEDKNSLAEALKTFAQLKQEEYESFREHARQLQEQRFLAETNYQRLADLWMQS